ncbi:hypothetical protein CLU93_4462 [Janthinobacterium sp. 35]|uniref:hypothetical protein n=1 Tax=Janthinobacterium sp. 35 TaxID=2035210 RepID=UPI000C37D90D|nr:hypothetical protein [Janthinobacterium sp. 35]PIG30127.1 hypothetical protein CLU93_4462 [Janthinobacterium sp. 35]
MSASQPALFNVQEFTDAGITLVGGRLYTYDYGTTTQKVAYTDPEGTIPQTYTADGMGGQYIGLNARGELPTPLYLAAGAYDISLKRADGSTVWTRRAEPTADAAAAITTSLASISGASVVGYLQAAGLAPRTVADKLQEEISLFDFIPKAQQAGILAKTSTYDASDNIINAIIFVSLLPSGTRLVAPRGKFVCSKSIPWKNNVTLVGKTKMATVFEFTHAGHGFVSTNPINSSTAANIGISNCTITTSNLASTGSAFVDVGGSYVDLDMVKITGFKYGSIFDQTEHLNVDRCEYITPAGGIGIWIVNGPDFTPGVLLGFTNKIAITRNQFNADPAALYNILDDGGGSHAIRDNNFNAGFEAIRASGVYGLEIRSNESEVHTVTDFRLTDTTVSGAYVGPCVGYEIATNLAISPAIANILMDHASNGVIAGNCFGQSPACINFTGGSNNQSTGNVIEGNTKLVSGVGRSTTGPFVAGSSTSIRQNSIRQVAATYSPSGASAGVATITPKTMESIGIGTRMRMVNTDGTNSEYAVVSSVTSTTFTITLATSKAVDFQIYGATPFDQEQGLWPVAPALGASVTNGTHTGTFDGTFSRRGNEVTISGTISITAKDAAISGALQIRNLPYPAAPAPNSTFLVNISLFSGFTFGGGAYTMLSGIISPGSNLIDLRKSGSGLAVTTVPATDLPGTTVTVIFSGTYLTSAL